MERRKAGMGEERVAGEDKKRMTRGTHALLCVKGRVEQVGN
jgi:hypothetical protein